MWPFRKTRIFTSSSLRAMGLPNSKEFQEAFYLKEKKLQSHLDQRRKLFEAIESSVNEKSLSGKNQIDSGFNALADKKDY